MLFFAVSLLAALILLQELIALVAHQITGTARALWLVAAKLLLGALMLWLYCAEVQHFERHNVTELAPDGAARRASTPRRSATRRSMWVFSRLMLDRCTT